MTSLREIKDAVAEYDSRWYGDQNSDANEFRDYLKVLLPVVEAAAEVAKWRYSITVEGGNDEWMRMIDALEALKALDI